MVNYKYKARDSKGKLYTGILQCETESECYAVIRERNQFCIEVVRISGSVRMDQFIPKKVNIKSLSLFCRQFSTMLSTGITVIKCLDILYEQTEQKNLKLVIQNVYELVQKGEALSSAMRRQAPAFPELLINMIETGELSGTLDSIMRKMADHYEKDNALHKKVTGALMYPIILSVLCVLVVVVCLVFVIPTFVGMFDQFGAKLPPLTQMLINLSNSMTQYWYVYLMVVLGIFITLKLYIKTKAGRRAVDKMKVRMPGVGKLNMTIVSARFARTLASMFSSGVSLIQSLEMVAKVVNNTYVSEFVLKAVENVKKGMSLNNAIKKTGIFQPMMCSMINIGEETGALDELMIKTTLYYDEESSSAVSKLVTMIEPIMIIFMAVIVLTIILAVIMPVFQMYNNIG